MPSIKRLTVLLVCGWMILAPALKAQTTDRADRTLEMLREKLSLSDEQSSQIRDILSTYLSGTQKGISGAQSATRLQPRTITQRLRSLDHQIDDLLTAAQKEKFPAIRKELHSRLDPRFDRSAKRKQ